MTGVQTCALPISGQRDLRETQKHGGTGDRHRQIGARIPSVLVAGAGKRQRRMEFGGAGVELEANVQYEE